MDDFEKNQRKTFDIMAYIREKKYTFEKTKENRSKLQFKFGRKMRNQLKIAHNYI